MPPHRCRRRRHAHVLGRPPYWDTQAYLVEQPPPHSSRMRISTRHRNLQIHGCCTDRMNSPVVVISVVIRSVTALPVRNPAAHLVSGEAWLWVVVFAVLMLIQSTALSLQQGVEHADVDADQPSQPPARPSS